MHCLYFMHCRYFMYGAAGMFVPFGHFLPAGVAIVWVTNGWVQVGLEPLSWVQVVGMSWACVLPHSVQV